MKYMTKMIMVPQQAVSQINQVQDHKNDGIDRQVSEFKTALQKIMTDDSLTSETQMQLYNQLFTRYLKLDSDSKEPATVIMKNENQNSDKQDSIINDAKIFHDRWKDAIFQKMPKIHKEKARGLIDFLDKSKELRILDNGEVSINNTIVPQSNIVNLVHDIVRDRPKAPGPLGYKNIVVLLKDLKIPKELVGNPTRWKMINEDFQTPDTKTPRAKLKRKLQYTDHNGSADQNGSGISKKNATKVCFMVE